MKEGPPCSQNTRLFDDSRSDSLSTLRVSSMGLRDLGSGFVLQLKTHLL